MNRRIRTAHGLGDAPSLVAPLLRMTRDRLLAKALQRQSGSRSCGSGSAPAVARSGRITRRQRPAPLRVDASRPDTRTGSHPFLRPHEPTLRRPLGRSASLRYAAAPPSYRRRRPPPLQGQRRSDRLASRPQSTPIAAIARPRVEEQPVGRDRSFPSGRSSLRPMFEPGLAAHSSVIGGGDTKPG